MENNANPQPQLEHEGQYLVRIRKNSWEIEVSAPDKNFVTEQIDKWVAVFDAKEETISEQTQVIEPVNQSTQNRAHQENDKPPKAMTLPEFIEGAKFVSNLDKILTYGYWIEIEKNQKLFTIDEIANSFRETGEKPPANLKRDLASLKTRGLLMAPEKNQEGLLTYQVSNKGMKQVKAFLGLS